MMCEQTEAVSQRVVLRAVSAMACAVNGVLGMAIPNGLHSKAYIPISILS